MTQSRSRILLAAAIGAISPFALNPSALGQTRVMGIDVSEFQGSVNWSTVKNTGGKSFAFIRSSRGGTTGSSTGGGGNTIGLGRYDDPQFYTHMANSKAAGVYAGSYHFARADIFNAAAPNFPDSSTGPDEATHYLQRAGMYMKPGYLLPVLDLESGNTQRDNVYPGDPKRALSEWATSFADTIYAAAGVYPIIYMNSSYANSELNSSVPAKMPHLWLARPNTSSNPETGNPIAASGLPDPDGIWPTWKFWQYNIPSVDPNPINVAGVQNEVDLDVGHGTIEWLKDFLVPAFWTAGSSGSWSATSNWNSHNAGYNGNASSGPPSRAPGNISGTPNLSGIDDTVILDNTMTAAAYTVTLDAGSFNIRKLYVKRPLNITGGSLTINYDPTTAAAIGSGSTILGSTAFSAQFSQAVSMTGGALSVHSLLVDNTRTFTFTAGTLTLNTLTLTAGSTPAKLLINGDVTLNPLGNVSALITTNTTTNSGAIDLGGGTRTLTIGNGSADVDLTLNVPLSNGSITKAGAGALQLNKTSTFNSIVSVNAGTLIATVNNQLGTGASVAAGGSLYLAGNLSYNLPLTLAGAGAGGASGATPPGKPGNLHVPAGFSATWSGPVSLTGPGSNVTDATLNTVSAASGATLTLSGIVSGAALAKAENGTVILTGSSPNTYTGLSRIYGGRLILEKDAALGTADAHTFMLAGSASTIAFRAPASSPAGFTYATAEFLMTEGAGNAGLGQIDNLAGNNTFAGSIAIGGPGDTGSIGVSAGSLTITGGLYARSDVPAARTINKLGSGTLVLAGDNSADPAAGASSLTGSTLNAAAGLLELRATSLAGLSNFNVAAGAVLLNTSSTIADAAIAVDGTYAQQAGRLSNASLTVNSGATAILHPSPSDPSTLSSLTLSGTGSLDLTTNDLVLNSSGSSAVAAVRQYLLNNSLTSSAPDPDDLLSLAYLDDGSAIRIHLTYTGDANLDGRIDADDFALADAGFAMGDGLWWRGDFNFDGIVDQNDFLLIDRGFALQSGPLAEGFLSMRESQFGGDYVAQLLTSIPEPSSLAACLLAGTSLLSRRRRAI